MATREPASGTFFVLGLAGLVFEVCCGQSAIGVKSGGAPAQVSNLRNASSFDLYSSRSDQMVMLFALTSRAPVSIDVPGIANRRNHMLAAHEFFQNRVFHNRISVSTYSYETPVSAVREKQ